MNSVEIIILGGLDGIGRNMMAIRYEDDILLIDAGLMFPDPDYPGISKVLPDLSYVRENRERIRGLVLTHGHEDHIGALSFLFQEIMVPIYGTKLTIQFAQDRLRFRGLWRECDFIEIADREKFSIGSFTIEAIPVCHSIPDGIALHIQTPVGNIVHSGDFKIDPTPVDGRQTDMSRFKELGQDGVMLMLSDSTNADVKGHTKSESSVGIFFDNIFKSASGRVIVASFASHIHRIQQVIRQAVNHNRKIVILGNAMVDSVRIAEEAGAIQIPAGARVKADEAMAMDPSQLAIITTGSQGEYNAVLSKIANANYQGFSIEKGDTVVLSSKPIPGNERYVNKTIDSLFRRGATVYYDDSTEAVHVSGHGFQEELIELIQAVRPRHFVPIHGDYRHLRSHVLLAASCQIPESNIFILNNGDVLSLHDDSAAVTGTVPGAAKLVDGYRLIDIDHPIIAERKELSKSGLLWVTFVYSVNSFQLIADPTILSTGLIYKDETKVLSELNEFCHNSYKKIGALLDIDPEVVQEEITNELTQYVYLNLKRRPVIAVNFIPIQS